MADQDLLWRVLVRAIHATGNVVAEEAEDIAADIIDTPAGEVMARLVDAAGAWRDDERRHRDTTRRLANALAEAVDELRGSA